MRLSFYDYMMGFLNDSSAEGDLARDMRKSGDCLDLSSIRSWSDLSVYLRLRQACPECIQIARQCWQNYCGV